MARSLKLIFDKFHDVHEPVLATNALHFGDVPAELPGLLKDVALPLPQGIEHHMDDQGLVRCNVDAYGKALTFTMVGLLGNLLEPHCTTQWQHATRAFLAALPSDMQVVLYWH